MSQARAAQEPARRRARTINALTEEQIRHKRQVDRKAQRAFRQRTKDCIARLEQEIAESLEKCRRQEHEIQGLRTENQGLVQRLATIAGLATTSQQPSEENTTCGLDDSNDNSVRAGDARQDFESRSSVDTPPPRNLTPTDDESDEAHDNEENTDEDEDDDMHIPAAGYACSPSASATIHVSTREPEAAQAPPADAQQPSVGAQPQVSAQTQHDEVQQQEHSESHAANTPQDQIMTSYQQSPQQQRSVLLPDTPPCDTSVHLPMFTNSTPGEEVHCAILTPNSSTMTTDMRPLPVAQHNRVHMVLPAYSEPTCPLDAILLDFLTSSRESLRRKLPLDVVLGPEKQTVKALFNPELTEFVPPLSAIMTGVLSTFRHVAMTERLAFFYVMCLTTRWKVCPTKKHYDAMPTWLRPTVTQVTVPHALWIDNIPWPGVRDLLIEDPDRYPFSTFSNFYSLNVRLNWQFDSVDAVSNMSEEGVLHSIFEKHVRCLRNWTVDAAFRAQFPEMIQAIAARE